MAPALALLTTGDNNTPSLADVSRAGGSKVEVARPALPHKLFMMMHSCHFSAFLHFLPLAVTYTECSNFRINVTDPNCKLAEDAMRWHLDVHRFALILQTFTILVLIIHDAGQKVVQPWPDWPDRFR